MDKQHKEFFKSRLKTYQETQRLYKLQRKPKNCPGESAQSYALKVKTDRLAVTALLNLYHAVRSTGHSHGIPTTDFWFWRSAYAESLKKFLQEYIIFCRNIIQEQLK